MVAQHYRWDFIGLSTDTKPTPQTSEKVVNGSTFYCSDTSKLYVWCNSEWYEKTATGGGGGTSDFEDLTNRPKYNSVTMDGSTNIPEVINTDFVGTDGTSAGSKGLVPAPAITDAGKFLKADGTWSEAGGGEPDYSESEVNTGTKWIDGKTIYKKSYSMTIVSNSGSQSFNLLINNLYEIVKVDGIAHVGGTLTNAIALNYSGLSFDQNLSLVFYSGQCEIASSNRKDTVLKITVYYTKSV